MTINQYGGSWNVGALYVFLDLVTSFDLVSCAVLWHCISLNDFPSWFISIFRSFYVSSRDRIRASSDLPSELSMRIDIAVGWCPSFFLNFVIEKTIAQTILRLHLLKLMWWRLDLKFTGSSLLTALWSLESATIKFSHLLPYFAASTLIIR